VLEVKNVSVAYDQTKVVHDVSFSVADGTCRALIGPNGAGKSSLLNAIAGRVKPIAGEILYEGRDIAGLRSDVIAEAGISLSPQDRQIFTKLTVRENLLMGSYRFRKDKKRIATRLAYVLDVFPKLEVLIDRRGAGLSGGEQQMVSIGRALMAEPTLLILDEPSAALAPVVVEGIFDVIGRIGREGTTLLLAEQNVTKASSVADDVLILARGEVHHDGPASEMGDHQQIVDAYLGTSPQVDDIFEENGV
jgi:branched-chain amino acid transport system ATP-binding protein